MTRAAARCRPENVRMHSCGHRAYQVRVATCRPGPRRRARSHSGERPGAGGLLNATEIDRILRKIGRPGIDLAGRVRHGFARRLRGDGMRIPLVEHTEATEDVEDIIAAIRYAAERAEFFGGPHVERFEAAWANFCGTEYAIGVADGIAAIELTLRGLGIGPGDEVLVPTNTYLSTAEAVSAAGATPRFVDVDPTTLLVTPDTLEPARTSRTAAIIAVHLYGHPAGV